MTGNLWVGDNLMARWRLSQRRERWEQTQAGSRMWKSLEWTKWEKLSDKEACGRPCTHGAHTCSEWPINHVTAHLAQSWRSLSKLAPHGQKGGVSQAVGNQSRRLRLLHSERLEPCTSTRCISTQSTKHRRLLFCAHMALWPLIAQHPGRRDRWRSVLLLQSQRGWKQEKWLKINRLPRGKALLNK